MLLEDNDPKHTSNVAEAWREKNHIDHIAWPSNSPNMSLIENVWNILKNLIAKLRPSNLTELEKNIKTECSNLPLNLAEVLVSSISDRMKQVIARKGDSIDY